MITTTTLRLRPLLLVLLLATLSSADTLTSPASSSSSWPDRLQTLATSARGRHFKNILANTRTTSPSSSSSSSSTTTETSWAERLQSSLIGVLLGLFLFISAFPLLMHSEGSYVHRMRVLDFAEQHTVVVAASEQQQQQQQQQQHIPIDHLHQMAVGKSPASGSSANHGRLVCMSATARPQEVELCDTRLAIAHPACLRLGRHVEMYQIKAFAHERNEKDAFGGGERTITTYTYKPVWSSQHENLPLEQAQVNPPFPLTDTIINSCQIGFGDAHILSDAQTNRLNDWKVLRLSSLPSLKQSYSIQGTGYRGVVRGDHILLSDTSSSLPPPVAAAAAGEHDDSNDDLEGNSDEHERQPLQQSTTASGPLIGDLRISYQYIPVGVYTVVARDTGRSFACYTFDDEFDDFHLPECCDCCSCCIGCCLDIIASGNTSVDMIEKGQYNKRQMYQKARRQERWKLNVLRLLGTCMMVFGLYLTLMPIKVVLDVISFVGSVFSVGGFLVSFILGVVCASLTMGSAWLMYRPIKAIGFLLVAVGIIGLVVNLHHRATVVPN